MKELPVHYGQPGGGLLLVKDIIKNEFIGCVGVRRIEPGIAELKRMYIKKEYRNLGIGKKLLDLAIDLAKELNYEKLRLDTLDFMRSAITLYKAKGFREIDGYRYNPKPGALYFELDL